MTMRFVATTNITSLDGTLRYLFAWLDFMRTASPAGPGWSVPRSSNGVTGGAGDNIAAFADLSQFVSTTSESWFVLRSPDGLKEFLFFRVSTSDIVWQIRYSPAALFVGGTAGAEPTATDSVDLTGSMNLTSQAENVLHMGADDAAPYGFFAYSHFSGNFSDPRAAMAWIPITSSVQPGDIDPYVFAIQSSSTDLFTAIQMGTENTSTTGSRCVSIPPGQALSRTTPALQFRSASGTMFPSSVPINSSGQDISSPIPFGVRSGISAPNGFKGFSNFVQWNGAQRAAGETFATKTRISLGDVNFPWDGSVPSTT